MRALKLNRYCDNRVVLKMEQKDAIRELFEDPDFIERFQTTVLIPAIETAVAAANSQRDEKITELEEELTKTKAELERTNEQLASTQQRLDAIESYSRRNCLTISGIPERDGESTDQLIVDVAKAAGVTITTGDLDRSHRIGQTRQGRHRNIIVKLLSHNVRQRLYEARRDLSAHRVPNHSVLTREVLERVFIADLLTQKSQHLLYIGRQLKKKGKVSAAYSTNGAVKVRTAENQPPKTITDIADFTNLLGAGDPHLQEVLATSGHPSSHGEGAGSGRAGTASVPGASNAAASHSAWERAGRYKSNGKPSNRGAHRPQTRASHGH